MKKKNKNPAADGTARGAGTSESNDKTKRTKNGQAAQGAVQKVFEACRSKRDTDATRKLAITARVRAVALAIGAVRAADFDDEWIIKCPGCGRTTSIFDVGTVRSRGCRNTESRTDCSAVVMTQRIVRDAVADNRGGVRGLGGKP